MTPMADDSERAEVGAHRPGAASVGNANAETAESPRVTERVLVVIVTHVGIGDDLRSCVESVRRAGGADEIVVVDNSGIATSETPSEHFGSGDEAPPVSVIPSDNHGYGAAFNLARTHPAWDAAEFVALLNDDALPDEGWLTALRDALGSDPMVGVAQPKLVLAGTEPPLINSLGVELDGHGAGLDIGLGRPESEARVDTHDISIFSGGALLFRRTFIDDLGGFDERYFLYYEDVDLALRGAERGWVYRCAPASRVVHAMGATTDRIADERLRLQERNRLTISARFGSANQVRAALWLSIRRLRHRPRHVHARALMAGSARMPRAAFERTRARRSRR